MNEQTTARDKYDDMSRTLLEDIYRGETMAPWREIFPLTDEQLRERIRELRGEPLPARTSVRPKGNRNDH